MSHTLPMPDSLFDLHDTVLPRAPRPIARRRRPLSQEVVRSISILKITLLLLAIGLSAAFFLVRNQMNQKGYQLQQARLQKDALIEESKDLTQQITEVTSSLHFEKNPQLRGMVKIETPTYVRGSTR